MRERCTSKLWCMLLLLAALSISLTGCTKTHWKFIVTGDSRGDDNGVNVAILSELAAETADKGVDFILFSGDLVTGKVDQTTLQSQLNNWRKTMQPVYDAGIGIYVVRGNHDLGKPAGITAWNNVFSDMPDNGPTGEKNLTYSFEHKNAFIVGLDQYVNGHRVNQAWLDNQLAANTKPHIFVFGHEPAFRARHKDCLDDYPARRNAFWNSIEKVGAKIYFCGHDHFYNHARIDNDGNPDNDIHQYIVGTAGAPLYKWSQTYDGDNSGYTIENISHAKRYGYCLVKIDGLDVTVTWMQRTDTGQYEPAEVFSYSAVQHSQR